MNRVVPAKDDIRGDPPDKTPVDNEGKVRLRKNVYTGCRMEVLPRCRLARKGQEQTASAAKRCNDCLCVGNQDHETTRSVEKSRDWRNGPEQQRHDPETDERIDTHR
jgi:hypothetical protein